MISNLSRTSRTFLDVAKASALGLVLANAASALEVPYDYHVLCTPENAIFGHFSATKTPVLTVKSGAVVRIDGGGGAGGLEDRNKWLKDNNVPMTVEESPVLQEIMHAQK